MKVQIINYNGTHKEATNFNFDISPLSSPKSLDEYDINIIDISATAGIWVNKGNSNYEIDCIKDFQSIQTMITHSEKSVVLFVLPKNTIFRWDKIPSRAQSIEYYYNEPLKDNIDIICKNILTELLPDYIMPIDLIFENTRTNVGGELFEADFYFNQYSEKILSKSLHSNKTTTILINQRLYATTLNITSSLGSLEKYLNCLFSEHQTEEAPDWLNNMYFFDDLTLSNCISNSMNIISTEQEKIKNARDKLEKNMKYKSILYTNGNELVDTVFEILQQILCCNLSDFVDENKEDFLIKSDKGTIIGEIKGVTSNVKFEHISQLEVHYRRYLDQYENDNTDEYINQILIMNPFRNKELTLREPINEQQIKLAKRNGCLIIETITLLQIFEKFLDGTLSTELCWDIFLNNTGLLKLDDIIYK